MAKLVRRIRLELANGETRVFYSKTCTEKYVRALIADVEWTLPAKVIRWEVLG